MSENGGGFHERGGGIMGAVFAWYERVLKSKTSANLLIIALILLVCIPLFGIDIAATRPIEPLDLFAKKIEAAGAPSATRVFNCDKGRSVNAVVSSDEVHLQLSDGRHITLPKVSVSGAAAARYANPDGSFVFSDSGSGAFIQE